MSNFYHIFPKKKLQEFYVRNMFKNVVQIQSVRSNLVEVSICQIPQAKFLLNIIFYMRTFVNYHVNSIYRHSI